VFSYLLFVYVLDCCFLCDVIIFLITKIVDCAFVLLISLFCASPHFTAGNVIHALAKRSSEGGDKSGIIPYRNSVLTRLLQVRA
jgi:hypothetical protein